MSFFFAAMAHKTDPLLTDIHVINCMEYKDFGLDGELNTTLIKTRRKIRRVLAISKSVTALLDNSPIPFYRK
jgi:hypothetical protein